MKKTIIVGAAAALVALSGCSTSQSVTSGKQAVGAPMTNACLFVHGGNSSDMDANVQRGLEDHGVNVVTTPQCDRNTAGIDMTVTYTDQWRWDIVMFLKAVDVRFYTAPGGKLITSGHWNNSLVHSFPNAPNVVSTLMDQMFADATGGAVRTDTAAK